MRLIDVQQLDDIALGAALLGTGGVAIHTSAN